MSSSAATSGSMEESTVSNDEAKIASTSDTNDAVAAQLRVYESWFPPMCSMLPLRLIYFDVKIGDFLMKMTDAVCCRAFIFGAIADNNEFEQ